MTRERMYSQASMWVGSCTGLVYLTSGKIICGQGLDLDQTSTPSARTGFCSFSTWAQVGCEFIGLSQFELIKFIA